MTQPQLLALRGEFAHCKADPRQSADALQHLPDGVMLIRDGRIEALGPAESMLPSLPADLSVEDRRGYLIVPGFVDCHTHYVQTDIIASHGEQLLNWLERYTFPAEAAFVDPAHACEVAGFFCDQLLLHGTTTAMVFATVHGTSADAIFAAAQNRHMRLIAGRCLMDRNVPSGLLDDPTLALTESRRLIDTWHGVDRLAYALTPRYAPACSDALMQGTGALLKAYPDLYLQTHLAENRAEVALAAQLHPHDRSYLAVYDRYGQLGPRSVLAHGIWIDAADRSLLAQRGSAIAFCPGANLFLGSGLFDLAAADAAGVHVGLGSDVGAGTSLSMLRILADAYKVLQLQGQLLSPARALYLATLGGARSLRLEQHVGSFEAGRDADLVLLDPAPTPLMARRLGNALSLDERLFIHMTLGDDRSIAETRVLGRVAHSRLHDQPRP